MDTSLIIFIQKLRSLVNVPPYYSLLKKIHSRLKPQKYIEIGIYHGESLVLANKKTECIGVDPNPKIRTNLNKNTKIFKMTSDDYFAQYSDSIRPVDLAFIDGMHLFEFVLRDFINLEKVCTPSSIIMMHDTMPKDELTSTRVMSANFWTGDVYKIIPILQKYRPDLKIYNTNDKFSGLAIIKNLNPNSTVLMDNYNKIVDEFMNYNLDFKNKSKVLDLKPLRGVKKFLHTNKNNMPV